MSFPHTHIVRKYLSQEFPGLPVADAEDFDLHAHRFKITDGALTYLLKISIDFAMDTDAQKLANLLQDEGIADHMKNPEFSYVMISNDGVAPIRK